jgi:integrase
MNKSTRLAPLSKPAKPHKDFPLFPHATRRWAKKVRGKFVFFGPWADPDAALEKWLAWKDDLLAGKTPRISGDGLTVKDLANRFLTAKTQKRDSGELSPRTFASYYSTCERLISAFGKMRLVTDLAADDFEKLRAGWAKDWGPIAVGNEVQRVRCVFRYAHENALIDAPVRFGTEFRRPSRKTLRKARNANGPRMFEAEQLRRIIDVAEQPMKAAVLLGLNAAFGNTDVGMLPLSALDLDGGWVRFPRPKTEIERRCPLWPETTKALRAWLKQRPKPRDEADAGLVFITKYRQRFVKVNEKGHPADALGQEFAKLLDTLKLRRPGLGFYALRHVFQTIADGARDPVATSHIMGHADSTMAGQYRERIDDARLKAVTDHVRRWLFPPKKKASKKAKPR